MITAITLKDFKSIHLLEDLPLGQVNVFVGANGSGKSNFLEAVGVLSAAASGIVDDQALMRRGVRPGVPALYKFSQKNERLPLAIVLSATYQPAKNKPQTAYRVRLHNPAENPQPRWQYKNERIMHAGQQLLGRAPRGATLGFGPERSKEKEHVDVHRGYASLKRGSAVLHGAPQALLEILDDYAIFSPTTPTLRGVAPDTAPRRPVGLYGGQLAEAVKSLLHTQKERFGTLELDELLELLDWVENFYVGSPSKNILSPSVPTTRQIIRFQDAWMHEKRNALSGYDASEGALYILFMLVLAMHTDSPHFLAIDNFDQSLHPLLARELTKVFCQQVLAAEKPRQVLLTTHNPLVLNGLNLWDERIRLFVVDRVEGATQIKRLNINATLITALKEKRVTLSDLWVMGRLGGVPRLL